MGNVGCKSTAAVHFSPPFCPIAGLLGCKSGKNCPRWGRFSLSTPQARQAHEETPGRSQVSSHPLGGPGEARAGGAPRQATTGCDRAPDFLPSNWTTATAALLTAATGGTCQDAVAQKRRRSQLLHELQRAHHHVRVAIAPGSLELEHHLPGGVDLYSFVGQCGSGDVPAKLLQPLALISIAAHRRM